MHLVKFVVTNFYIHIHIYTHTHIYTNGDTLPGDGPADQQDDDPDDPTNRARPSAGFVVFLS